VLAGEVERAARAGRFDEGESGEGSVAVILEVAKCEAGGVVVLIENIHAAIVIEVAEYHPPFGHDQAGRPVC